MVASEILVPKLVTPSLLPARTFNRFVKASNCFSSLKTFSWLIFFAEDILFAGDNSLDAFKNLFNVLAANKRYGDQLGQNYLGGHHGRHHGSSSADGAGQSRPMSALRETLLPMGASGGERR